jgi:hypothetical protein
MVREIQCTDEYGYVMGPPHKKKTANNSETVYGEGSGPGLVPLNQELATPLHNRNKEKRKRKATLKRLRALAVLESPLKLNQLHEESLKAPNHPRSLTNGKQLPRSPHQEEGSQSRIKQLD